MERALSAEHSFWSDFFWIEPAFSPGRNESTEEGEGGGRRREGEGGEKVSVAKYWLVYTLEKEVIQEEGQFGAGVGQGSRKL